MHVYLQFLQAGITQVLILLQPSVSSHAPPRGSKHLSPQTSEGTACSESKPVLNKIVLLAGIYSMTKNREHTAPDECCRVRHGQRKTKGCHITRDLLGR